MVRAFSGAVLIIAGIVGFIEAHSHRPVEGTRFGGDAIQRLQLERAGVHVFNTPASGLSPTNYDLLRIGAWALVIVGALLVVVGLIAYARAER